MEDLVGVGVADAGEDARIGEGALEGAVLRDECVGELFGSEGEDVEAAGVECGERFFALHEMQGGAAFGSGFGESEGAVGEVEGGEVVAAAEGGAALFCVELTPVETAGDHQVQDEEEVVIKGKHDALAEAAKFADGLAFDGVDARDGGAEEEWGGDAQVFERLTDYARGERGEVGRDVRELGHRLFEVAAIQFVTIDIVFAGDGVPEAAKAKVQTTEASRCEDPMN